MKQSEELVPAIEFGADQLDALLKGIANIPGVKQIYDAYSAFASVKNWIELKKLFLFLRELDSIPAPKRLELASTIDGSVKSASAIGEKITLLIARHDDMLKASLLGRAFREYLLGTINYTEFLDVAHAIDTVQVHYLRHLPTFYSDEPEQPSEDVLQQLSESGTVGVELISYKSNLVSGLRTVTRQYSKTRVGELVVKLYAQGGESKGFKSSGE